MNDFAIQSLAIPHLIRCAVLTIGLLIYSSEGRGELSGGDNFDDGRKSTESWDDDFIRGKGRLTEAEGRIQFSNANLSGVHEAAWPWILTTASYSEDWDFQMDVENLVSVIRSTQSASIGIYVNSLRDESNLAYIEFYSAYFDELGRSVNGFSCALENRRGIVNEVDTFELPVTSGAVRIDFDSSDKVLRLLYHVGDAGRGYGWQVLGHYGLDGDDGVDANESWRLGARDEFDIGIFGFAENVSVRIGELSGDRFTADGSDLRAEPLVTLFLESVTGSSIQIGWESFEDYRYAVQQSGDLATWNRVGAPMVGDGTVLFIELERNPMQNFVRVITELP